MTCIFHYGEILMNEQYEFFCGGPFSQWHRCNFQVGGIKFISSKQYMMYNKAMLFNDIDTAKLILQASDPKVQKSLGRVIKSFSNQVWMDEASSIVFRGQHAKFSQNRRLYDMLMSANPLLVEASQYDPLWGIGIDEATARRMSANEWPGRNLLGIILSDLREHFIMEEEYNEGKIEEGV